MQRMKKSIVLGATVAGLALGGCGGAGTTTSSATSAAVKAAAREMSPPDGRSEEERVNAFQGLLVQLRSVPQLAPLFDMYQVPDPVVLDDDERAGGLVDLLHAVRITVDAGTLTIVNRATGGVIFTAQMGDLASGVFHAENLPNGTGLPPPACTYAYSDWSACDPGTLTQTRTVVSATPDGCAGTPVLSQPCTAGTTPPPTCTSFTYSPWGDCQPDGTQTRTVLGASPAGCTGGSPVTSQACVYAAPTCTSFTYSPWGDCQPDGTQTRTVLGASPAGCTGGSPMTSQACVYTPPPDGVALYGQYCSKCHGPLATSDLKGKSISLSLIKSFNMTWGLTDAQLQAIVTAVGP